jgi:hypothetical protein
MTNDASTAANGNPDDRHDADRTAARNERGEKVDSAARLDPDAPGTSALGLTDGDAVEPNEPG